MHLSTKANKIITVNFKRKQGCQSVVSRDLLPCDTCFGCFAPLVTGKLSTNINILVIQTILVLRWLDCWTGIHHLPPHRSHHPIERPTQEPSTRIAMPFQRFEVNYLIDPCVNAILSKSAAVPTRLKRRQIFPNVREIGMGCASAVHICTQSENIGIKVVEMNSILKSALFWPRLPTSTLAQPPTAYIHTI